MTFIARHNLSLHYDKEKTNNYVGTSWAVCLLEDYVDKQHIGVWHSADDIFKFIF